MLRGVDGTIKYDDKKTKKKKITAEGEEEVDLENEILLEVLNEGRGEREDRGERDEWNRHIGWHRKENVGALPEQRHQRPRQQQRHASKDRHETASVGAADTDRKKGRPPQESNAEGNKAGHGERAGSQDTAAAHKLRGKGRNRNRDNDNRLPSLVPGDNIEGNRTLNSFRNSKNGSPSWPSLSSVFVVATVFFYFGALWMFRRQAPARRIGNFRRRSTKGRTL